jgi:hypothetical protein
LSVSRTWLIFMWIGLAGCQTPASLIAQSSCSFDQVWDTAIASLEGTRLQSADKARGRVETAWLEVESATRAGIFQRDVNKERVKYLITVTPQQGGATATVQQLREAWSPMGARMRQWRAIPANQSEEADLTAKISSRLSEKGC